MLSRVAYARPIRREAGTRGERFLALASVPAFSRPLNAPGVSCRVTDGGTTHPIANAAAGGTSGHRVSAFASYGQTSPEPSAQAGPAAASGARLNTSELRFSPDLQRLSGPLLLALPIDAPIGRAD